MSESGLEYLLIPGKQCLRETLKHCLQTSEKTVSRKKNEICFQAPQGKDRHKHSCKEGNDEKIAFIDVVGAVVGTLHVIPYLILKKENIWLNI